MVIQRRHQSVVRTAYGHHYSQTLASVWNWGAVLAVGVSILISTATGQDSVELELRVQQLVMQLDANARQEREAAEQALIELGTEVLPLLPEVDPATSAETKERLARIRSTLREARTTDTMAASRVQIEGEMTVREFFDKITKQTDNQIEFFRDQAPQQDRTISVAFSDTSFWPAVDQVFDQTGLTTKSFAREPNMLAVVTKRREETPRSNPRVSYVGPFRVEATEIQANRMLRRPASSSMRVRMEVMWEPRRTPLLVRQAYRDVQLKAEDGSQIPVASSQGVSEVPVSSRVTAVDVVIPIELPPRSVQKIATVEGTLSAMMPGRIESFEFRELTNARNVSQRRGSVEVTLDRVRRNGSVFEIRVRVTLLEEGTTFQSHLNWASSNEVYLVDDQGNRIGQPNIERYFERERSIGYAYLFPVAGDLDQYRLIYKTPVSILTVPVEYQLNDIPLP